MFNINIEEEIIVCDNYKKFDIERDLSNSRDLQQKLLDMQTKYQRRCSSNKPRKFLLFKSTGKNVKSKVFSDYGQEVVAVEVHNDDEIIFVDVQRTEKLDGKLRSKHWSQTDDERLLHYYQQYNDNWSKIESFIPKHDEKECRNRYPLFKIFIDIYS